MSGNGRSVKEPRLVGAIRGWMLIVPPLGLVAILALSVINIATEGSLNRRIVSSPELFRLGFFVAITFNLTIWVALIRVAQLPLAWKTRLNLMAWCALMWPFAIPLLELGVMPEADGLPPGHSGDEPCQDPWESALRWFHRRCKWALGIYIVIALEIILATALWSAWRG